MTGKPRIRLDHKGIEAWMKENLGPLTRARAEAVAAQVRTESGARVTVEHYLTDRPHSTVMLHGNGAAEEAKHGYLVRAATAQRLRVAPPVRKGGKGGKGGKS